MRSLRVLIPIGAMIVLGIGCNGGRVKNAEVDVSTSSSSDTLVLRTGEKTDGPAKPAISEKPKSKPSPSSEHLAALLEAAERGQVSRLQEIFKEGKVNLNDKDDEGNTALMKAAGKGHITVVKLLIVQGVELDEHNEEGATALMMAAANGHVSVIKTLLYPGEAADALDGAAIKLDQAAKELGIKRKFSEHADANHRDKTGQTALFKAGLNGHKDAVDVLRAARSKGSNDYIANDLIADNEGNTYWMAAAAKGQSDIAWSGTYDARGYRRFVEKNRNGMTLLMIASSRGDAELVGNIVEELPRTYQHLSDSEKIRKTCLEFVNQKDKGGKSALKYANEGSHTVVARLLKEAGAEEEKKEKP
jgi:ankyrin repeat protein